MLRNLASASFVIGTVCEEDISYPSCPSHGHSLVHTLECSSDTHIVLELDGDRLIREGFEEPGCELVWRDSGEARQ